MKQLLCIGTYTEPILFGTGQVFQGKGKGIYFCEFNDGELRVLNQLPLRNPSYLCFHRNANRIYAVNELKEYEGEFGGGITEVKYSPNGEMEFIRSACTGGTDPCHVALSPNENYIAVSNFASGSVSVFPLDSQGGMAGERLFYQHEGKSVDPIRQKGPHAHSAIFAPDGSFYVPDLGADMLVHYSSDGRQMLDTIALAPGSGPRFGVFSEDGKHFYLINELGSSVTHFTWENGALVQHNTVVTLPEDFTGDNICSDLHILPGGKFLCASNRGHNSICCFAIAEDGSLHFVDRADCLGETPRNFSADTTGEYVLVGNQDSDNIVTFRVSDSGKLTHVRTTEFPSPVCIQFL